MAEWLTYAQAAERLGLTTEAVRHRARRMNWPMKKPNKPNEPVEVQIPEGVRPAVRLDGDTPDHAEELERLSQQIKALEACVERVTTERDEARGEARGLQVAVETAEAARRDAEARAERAEQGRRHVEQDVAAARLRASQEHERADKAEEEATQARAQAEENANMAAQWKESAEEAATALEQLQGRRWWMPWRRGGRRP